MEKVQANGHDFDMLVFIGRTSKISASSKREMNLVFSVRPAAMFTTKSPTTRSYGGKRLRAWPIRI